MNAIPLDRSPEAAQDAAQAARLAFLATPSQATAETYRRRAFYAWKAITGTSIGWPEELAFLDRAIKRAIEMHENRMGRTAG